jgi:large subunit ribosomal protein L25
MEEIVLNAKRREVIGKQVKALRRQGEIPAVIYGRNYEPVAITLNFREASRILPGLSSSHLIKVDVDGEPYTTLVREKQRHPVRGDLIHVDFLAVSMTEKLRASVPLAFEGVSPAVEDQDGILVTSLEQVEVESLPRDLPERIAIDISRLLNIGDSITVRDLVVPAKVEILTNQDEIVAVVTAPAAEEVEEVAEAADEPEVIERGKKEEEEEF